MTHSCKLECVAGWQPSHKCHCAGCGENFSTEANFMRHFVNEKCVDPATRGLVQNKRGVWIKEGDIDFDERFGR